MTALMSLAVPIVLSAVIVFFASSVLHMALPWHRSDYSKMPKEDQVRAALRPLAIPPGDYLVPHPDSPGDMRSPEFVAKLTEGPILVVTVRPNGPMSMATNLALWFLYSAVISLLAGYIASRALPPGSEYLRVFQFVGASAFLGYAAALWQMSIWYRRAWLTTIKSTVDGLIYASLTAGVFGWLWPR
jgi:hypothetical protein